MNRIRMKIARWILECAAVIVPASAGITDAILDCTDELVLQLAGKGAL